MASAGIPDRSPEQLVSELRDLHFGPLILPKVVACGDLAVAPLEAVLRGPSESIPHRRVLAADALASIASSRAVAALARGLRDSAARGLSPILAEAEAVLISHIADRLSTHSNDDVQSALREALGKAPYSGCIRALSAQGDTKAIPLIVNCLFDDTVRGAAVEGLRSFQLSALSALVRLLNGGPDGQTRESPRHVEGRAAAAGLLGRLRGDIPEYALMRALLDPQGPVRLAAALALSDRRDLPSAAQAADVLVKALGRADWALATTLGHALLRLGDEAHPALHTAILSDARTPEDIARSIRAIDILARGRDKSAIPLLASQHRAFDPHVRLAALNALIVLPGSEAKMLRSFISDNQSLVRRSAVEALYAQDKLDPERTVQLLGDGDRRIRLLAANQLRAHRNEAHSALRRAALDWGAPLEGWLSAGDFGHPLFESFSLIGVYPS